MVFVDRDSSRLATDHTLSAHERPSGGIGQPVIAPDMFRTLGVTATPTMVLVERRHDQWVVTDAAVGADGDWLHSRLNREVNPPDAQVVDLVRGSHP